MRVQLGDLKEKLHLTLTGDEDWLARIHADYPLPAGAVGDAPKITGELTVEREMAGCALVEGHLAYAPIIPCLRCDAGVSYPIALDVHTRFYDEDPRKGMKDRKLSRDELDAYYLDNGTLDLEELVNDLVQTRIPTYVDSTGDENAPACANCAAVGNVEKAPTAETQKSGRESPFAALKGLKLKQ